MKLRDPSRFPPSLATLAVGLPGLLTLVGCQPDDDEAGFRITEVEFDNASTLTLTFSQPVAALGAVDPNAFRISAAQTYRYDYTYEGTTYTYAGRAYWDIGYLWSEYNYEYGVDPVRFEFASITPGAAPNQLVLTTETPLGPFACDWLTQTRDSIETYAMAYGQDVEFDLGLFLHYAGGSVPVESSDGEALADIAGHWAEAAGLADTSEEYGFTRLNPRLEIPCP